MAYKVIDDFSGKIVPEQKNQNTSLRFSSDTAQVDLPDASYVTDANIIHEGADLILEMPHGTVIIEGYFAQAVPPALVAPDGTMLTPELVNSFITGDGKYADASNSISDATPIGAVQEISGDATITRTDGKVETLGIGTPVYQGDIIETDNDGAVNIVFVDESTFAVSNDARLAIDEYIFDPSTQSGSSDFSVLKGVFVFTSGLIGRDDPDDVEISTPSGSIGIRGTIIAGDVDSGEITVIEGAIVLSDYSGHSITLSDQYETGRFVPSNNEIIHIGNISAHDVSNKYMSLSTVADDLFSTIHETDNSQTDSNHSNGADSLRNDGVDNTQDDSSDDNGGDQGASLDDGSVITSEDIVTTSDQPKSSVQEKINANIGHHDGVSTQETDNTLTVETQDVLVTPPFSITVEKFSFAENVSGATVARLTGEFSDTAYIHLLGISQNYFDITRESATSFLVSLKSGVSMDFENAHKLIYFGSPENHPPFTASWTSLDVIDINEPTHLTGDAPNVIGDENYFSASNGNSWSYDFSDAFDDPEGAIASYDLIGSLSNPGILSSSYDSTSGVMDITFGGGVNGSNFSFTINAKDSVGTLLKSMTINFDTIIQDNFSGILASNNETFSSSGIVNDSISVSSDDNNVFSDAGNDTVSITGNYNNIMAGSGSDTIILTSGVNNNLLGGSGDDTFLLSDMQDTKAYGGSESDVFVLNNAAAVTSLQTLTSGLLIDGGTDDYNWLTNTGDEIRLSNVAGNIDFTNIDDAIIKNIETINSDNSASETVKLSYSDVINMTDDDNILFVNMDSSDTLNFINNSGGNQFFSGGSVSNSGDTYEAYTDGTIILLVDTDAGAVTGL